MRNVLPTIVRRRPVVDRATRLAIAVTLVALLVRIALVTFGADPVTPHYSDAEYYDVVITQQPTSGVLFKLPYTRKGGKFTFDLHHRIGMTVDFGLPAEVRIEVVVFMAPP